MWREGWARRGEARREEVADERLGREGGGAGGGRARAPASRGREVAAEASQAGVVFVGEVGGFDDLLRAEGAKRRGSRRVRASAGDEVPQWRALL